MSAMLPVALIGAGPYGLSIAAHLRAHRIGFRIFGSPMHSWRMRMPAGMHLKSEGFASNLYDPDGAFTLKRYCAENGLDYRDMGLPVPIATMVAYGLAFQQRLVPEVEDRTVTSVEPLADGFRLKLADGETIAARRVVVAAGIGYYDYVPEEFAHLPPDLLTHSSAHHELGGFKGRDVTVIGAGASALDTAMLLDEAGARVRVVARRPKITWTDPPLEEDRPLWQRLRYPISGMTPGLRARFYEDYPNLFRYIPREKRLHIVKTFLGPAPAWWIRDKIAGRVELLLGHTPERLQRRNGAVELRVAGRDGTRRTLRADHVIAATGFKVDVRRLPFLDAAISQRLDLVEGSPVLSTNFESSVRGLYFAGIPSVISFGPLMRFMLGGGYAARRLAAHLAKSRVREPVATPAVGVRQPAT